MQAAERELTRFLLYFAQDVEECRLHSVAVQRVFPEKRTRQPLSTSAFKHTEHTRQRRHACAVARETTAVFEV